MKTVWGETIDPRNVLPEYPRPQMARASYLNLNGLWQYAIANDDEKPARWDGDILVPFSPESALSGVGRTLQPTQTLWYERAVTLPAGFCKGRVLLHFGAVDQQARVYVNGAQVCAHTGGYLPFCADITAQLPALANSGAEESPEMTFTLTVQVRDATDASFHARGKQKRKKGGIWYTPQSGIWQTVWIESVPQSYISALRITPCFDESAVEITVCANAPLACTARVGDIVAQLRANEPTRISLLGFTPWSPEHPHLYELRVQMGEDCVQSYFAMRKFAVQTDESGVKRLYLNNKPYFHNGVLDQGYWPDGLYTPPSDEAMVYDIQSMKRLGFNTLRKHIKIEPLRWYYHCDQIGMLVWQDAVNGGGKYDFLTVTAPVFTGGGVKDDDYKRFGRADAAGRSEYMRELAEMVEHLYNCPCIAMWVPFNEGWGQFDAAKALSLVESLDHTRTVDHASGWHDQGVGEVKSLHVYFKPYAFSPDPLGRAVLLSEFGGYKYLMPDHTPEGRSFGYKACKSKAELTQAYARLYEKEVLPAKEKGLAAAIYTQLSDVEGECNGLLTYDRKQVKPEAETLKEINARLADTE